MATGGRPSKLTPEVKRLLLEGISEGNCFEPAAKAAGISYRTFRRWMERGEKAKSGEFWQFRQEVTRAEADAEVLLVKYWRSQMPTDWRAARDFLARRYPERWANRERHEHTGAKGGPVQFDFEPREELLRRIDLIAGRSSRQT